MQYKIGKCIGCNTMNKIDDGVCNACLNNPYRGRGWAVTANKIRNHPESAMKVWKLLPDDNAKRVFIGLFGLPDGARHPDFKLQLVK